jgi:hypothetical protein
MNLVGEIDPWMQVTEETYLLVAELGDPREEGLAAVELLTDELLVVPQQEKVVHLDKKNCCHKFSSTFSQKFGA